MDDDEVGDAALADAVELAMLIDAVVDVVETLENMFWLVMVAVNPVTLLQPGPTELFVPATKLTAAH